MQLNLQIYFVSFKNISSGQLCSSWKLLLLSCSSNISLLYKHNLTYFCFYNYNKLISNLLIYSQSARSAEHSRILWLECGFRKYFQIVIILVGPIILFRTEGCEYVNVFLNLQIKYTSINSIKFLPKLLPWQAWWIKEEFQWNIRRDKYLY